MTAWVATGFGALDLRGDDTSFDTIELMVLATRPSVPLSLIGDGALLWRRLVEQGPVADDDLTPGEKAIIHEMEDAGLASADENDPFRIQSIPRPWLSSPIHELVYALLVGVTRTAGIPIVFVKGPALHAQGLRKREHSGDVDLWVEPRRIPELVERLDEWGWVLVADMWMGTAAYHSLTLAPQAWGCELDLHRHFPGIGLPEPEAFARVLESSEQVRYAGAPARVPERGTHAVLAALHLVRPDGGRAVAPGRVAEAAAALQSAGSAAADAAEKMCATAALAEVLRTAFPYREFTVGTVPANWAWRQQTNRVAGYVMALRTIAWRDRARVLRQLVWPTDRIALASERLAVGGADSPTAARFHRLGRGVRSAFDRVRRPCHWTMPFGRSSE